MHDELQVAWRCSPRATCLQSPGRARTASARSRPRLRAGPPSNRPLIAHAIDRPRDRPQLLPGNPVEEKDAKALAKALKRNTKFSLRQLLGLKPE